MSIIELITAILPSEVSLLEIILLTVGLWVLFKKCGMSQKWAFVPYYRMVALAECADAYEDGMTLFTLEVAAEIFGVVSMISVRSTGMNMRISRTTGVFSVFLIMLFFGIQIYRIRVVYALTKTFKTSRWWCVAGFVSVALPVLYWAFQPKVQPDKRTDEGEFVSNAAAESGLKVEGAEKGLTINIKSRTVKVHMKKRYLLRDIHMHIAPGRMVLLLGGSGAGKTTFLNAVTGYEPADAEIMLDGLDVYNNFDKMKYKIGFVPQQDLIRYNDTVQKTLADAAALRLPLGYSHAERMKRVKEVLEIFGLTPVKDNIVAKQSGGQKKRISIAMEFIADPNLFILDEPDSGLDGILARELMQRLHDISREGRIVIVITHTPDRVMDLFDDVIVLGKDANRTGRLVFYGPVEEAKEFFQVEKMEQIVRKINREDEGGEGLSDMLIEKYTEVCHGKYE